MVFGVGFLLTGLEVNAQDTSSPNNCGVRGLSLSEMIDSTWDTDCDSYALQSIDENFDTRADFYYFTIEERAVVVDINLFSEWFNTLILYDSNWEELEESDEDYYEQDSRINIQLEPGIYYLEAVVDEYHNLDVLSSGYTLALIATSSPNNCSVQGLSPYEMIDSTWDTDCDSYALQSIDENFDTRADFYYFTIEEGVIVDINLFSEWYNTLVLYDSNWEELEESDEDNYELYSKINTQLVPGIYYLEAVVDEYHNLDVRDSGYTLSLWEFDAQTRIATRSPNNCGVQGLSLYETVDSNWDTDCDSYALQSVDENFDTRADFYYFTIEERAVVDINLFSEWYNTLVLYDSNWEELEESDEDNYEQDSEINTQLEPGGYYLEAIVDEYHNLDGLDSGYTLSLWEFDAQTRITTNLWGTFDPIIGGTEILFDDSGCTLGFVAVLEAGDFTERGIVTNSHCSSIEGQEDNTVFYQDGNRITQTELGELADSRWYDSLSPENIFNSEIDKLLCLAGSDERCRYSDATFFRLDEANAADFLIARPEERNTQTPEMFVATTLNSNSPHLIIDRNMPYFQIVGVDIVEVGDRVHKVGATTGWTTGIVEQVCIDIEELLCQNEFKNREGYVLQGNGDSGSPVFKCVTRSGQEDLNCSEGMVLLVGLFHSSEFDQACFDEDSCVGDNGFFSSVHSLINEFNKILEDYGEICWVVSVGGDCLDTSSITTQRTCPITSVELNTDLKESWLEGCDAVAESQWTDYDRVNYYGLSLDDDMMIWANATTYNEILIPNILARSDNRSYGQILATDIDLQNGVKLERGQYLLEVAGDGKSDFRLRISTNAISPTGCDIQELPMGETIEFFWNDDCNSHQYIPTEEGYGTRAAFYQLIIEESIPVDLKLSSNWLNGLVLYDSSWDLLYESGGDYWERGNRIKTQLRSGTYYLEVATDEYLNRNTESPAYTLSHTLESTRSVLILIGGSVGVLLGILVISLIWLRLRRNRKKEDPPDWTRANS